MPQELKKQTEQVREVVGAFRVPIYEQDGYEADDLMGSLAKQAKEEVIIVTGDRDIFQLITGRIKVYVPKRGLSDPEVFDQREFEEHYGFKPQQLVDFKALVGDSSDNYPGVAGIGPKIATELIQQYGSLDKIYRRIGEISPKIAEKLKKDEKWARLSYRLAKIETQSPVRLNLKESEFGKYDPEEVRALFEELGFKSLLKRLPGEEEKRDEQIGLFE
jgi:DNA polymerase-1